MYTREEGGNDLELIVSNLFAPLLPCHALLLELAKLRRSQLLVLLRVNLVAHRVVLIIFLALLLVDAGTSALTFNPVVARGLEGALTHGPDFGADGLGEVAVVGDNENTSFEDLEGINEGSERLAIEVV